mmetsp:Transcript_18911/g.18061  ORF Transcript_18911/g.18061 Transcript_18911/m.18061 type:complete len:130 (+) Transcript_18911:554-943(+)
MVNLGESYIRESWVSGIVEVKKDTFCACLFSYTPDMMAVIDRKNKSTRLIAHPIPGHLDNTVQIEPIEGLDGVLLIRDYKFVIIYDSKNDKSQALHLGSDISMISAGHKIMTFEYLEAEKKLVVYLVTH